MDLPTLDTRTKIGLGLSVTLGILAFIPSSDNIFIIIKLIVVAALLVFVYLGASSSDLEKKVQLIVKDVRDNRRQDYRESLLKALSSFGQPVKLNEDPGEVAVAVQTRRLIADVKKKADASNLKIQHQSTVAILRYSSLEASGEMIVVLTGSATPGSTIEIEGVRSSFQVDASGSYAINLPLSLIDKHRSRGFIPARCKKGSLVDEIEIRIPS